MKNISRTLVPSYPRTPSSDKFQVFVKTTDAHLITVTLQDLTGKTLKSINNSGFSKNILQFDFDGKELVNGIYLVRIQNNDKIITRKLIIQK